MLSPHARVSIARLAWLLVLTGVVRAQGQTIDFGAKVTPTCELAGLVVTPASGWFNVPIAGPPKGHRGCQMMRTNERQEFVGVIRMRSVTAPAGEFAEDGYARLLASERAILTRMGYVLADDPLWTRGSVRVAGAGFGDARAVGVAARLEGNSVPQEVQFLLFRSESAKYVFALLTPAKAHSESLYRRNTDDFGTVIRTFKTGGL